MPKKAPSGFDYCYTIPLKWAIAKESKQEGVGKGRRKEEMWGGLCETQGGRKKERRIKFLD